MRLYIFLSHVIVEFLHGSNVLTKKLKQLEREGLITRRAVYESIPLRVEYKLTPLAKELDAIFIGLEKWIAKWESRDKLGY